MPYDTWRAIGSRIKLRSDASSWWLGDWLVFGRHQFGEPETAASDVTGLDDQVLDNLAVVARRFHVSRRRETLSFQHHADVCEMAEATQEHWLNLAAKNGWSKSELRLRIRDAARTAGSARSHDHVLRLSLTVEKRRERSWREAAERAGCRLEEWIAEALDAAASD
jgi:hypothetical protein